MSSSFSKTVLQGAQGWLLAETPHLPPIPIPRDRVCYPARPGRSPPDSAIWVKSPATGQDRPPRAEPQSRLGRPVGPGRLAHLLYRPLPTPSSASPPRRGQRGLPESAPASAQAGALGPPSGPAHPRFRGKGRLGLALGGKKAQRRRLLWASSAPGGRGGNTPRGSGPGDGSMWDRAAAGAADPGPTGKHRERRAHPRHGPRGRETAVTLTWLALGCADLALSVRASLPGLVAPQLPLSPLPVASAPPAARRPATPLLPGPPGPTHCAPAAPAPEEAATARSALSGNGAGQWPSGSASLRGGGALEDARAVGVLGGRWSGSAGTGPLLAKPVPFLPTQSPKQCAPGNPAGLTPS